MAFLEIAVLRSEKRKLVVAATGRRSLRIETATVGSQPKVFPSSR